MKKTLLFLIIISFIGLGIIKAQEPDWTVNAGDYSYNMTFTGVINLNTFEERDTADIIAAFVGDECRGVTKPVYKAEVDRYICYLMVYSNSVDDTITFKVYDYSSGQIITIPKQEIFEINGIVGSMQSPYVWSNPTLSSEAKILEFEVSYQTKNTVFDGNDIYCEIEWGQPLTNLVATFTTSELAVVKVNGVVQESGVTANDFSDTVVYWVRSADETDTNLYTVHVQWENYIPTDIFLSDTVIDASYHKGSFVGYFTTEDLDTVDIYSYSLVEGDGDDNNDWFLIDGNKLYLNTDVSFENIDSLSIRVRTDDGRGGTFEKKFVIYVDLLSENSTVRANHIISPNGDGVFDTWTVQNASLYSDCEFTILNPSGQIVFHSIGYDVPWDGTFNGQELPIGAYYYIIKTPDNIVYKGVITLIK